MKMQPAWVAFLPANEEEDDGVSTDEEEVQEVAASSEGEEVIDLSSKDAESWLKRIGLLEHAKLPWAICEKNSNAETQWPYDLTRATFLTIWQFLQHCFQRCFIFRRCS